jgi:WD40 repeat protein
VLKYFGATIDAVWGLNTVSLAPDDSLLTYVGSRAPEPGDKECGEGPCQRFALYKESMLTKNKTPRLVVKDVGPATFSPDGRQLVFVAQNTKLQFWTLATGRASKSVSIGANYATVAAAPAWQR